MTRLQHLLSQIKTVDELGELLNDSPAGIIYNIGISKDREQLIPCKTDNCQKCALYYGGHCTGKYGSMIKYLNTEMSDVNHKPSTVIIAMREKALMNLKGKFDKACDVKANPLLTAVLADSYCDLLEDIGLFEPNECHDLLIKATKERTKK